jgi:hypothetical protein
MSLPSSRKLGRSGECGAKASTEWPESVDISCFFAASPLKVRALLIFLGGFDGPATLPAANTARDDASGEWNSISRFLV